MQSRILAAATEEMRERGIKFTMSDLARRIGVSKRCLYEHFESKETLISRIVDASLVDIAEHRRKILSDNSLSYQEKLSEILSAKKKVDLPMEGRIAEEIKRFMPQEWSRIEHFMSEDWKVIEQFLTAGIEKGELRSVYLPVVHKMVKGSINELIDYKFLDENGISLTQARSYLADILLYGVIAR